MDSVDELNAPKFSLDQLDDNNLSMILSYLPMPNRILLERVSKRWQGLILRSLKKEKILQIFTEFPNITKLQISHIEKILQKCGENLTHLSFYMLFEFKPADLFNLTNKYCKNLEYLNTSSLQDFTDEDLLSLSDDILKNLKTLVMDVIGLKDSPVLNSFLEKAVKLEEFCASNNYYFEGSSLLYLSKTVKSLDLSSCSIFSDVRLMIGIFANLPNLETLDVSDTHVWAAGLYHVCHQLKSLTMTMMNNFFESDSFKELKFDKLEYLDASGQCINEEFIPFLTKKFPALKTLNLCRTGTADLDPTVFKPLKKLNIDRLIISCTGVTDEIVQYWTTRNSIKFKKLECSENRELTEKGLLKIIKTLPDLEFLYFGFKEDLDIVQFLRNVLQLVELRTKNIPLEIYFASAKKIEDEVKNLKAKKPKGRRPSNAVATCEVKIHYTFLKEKVPTVDDEEDAVTVYEQVVKFTPLGENSDKN